MRARLDAGASTRPILAGVPCHHGRVDAEATTPTGAAILHNLVSEFKPPARYTAERYGYGVGHKDFVIPNILRVSLGSTASPAITDSFYSTETNIELDCNIDDMPGEAFQPLLQALFALPVLDAYVAPIQMKKQRPAHKLSVLCQASQLDEVLATVFGYSTTLGVRTRKVQKWMLPREERVLQTSFGAVKVKLATTIDGQRRWKVEHDSLVALTQTVEQTSTRGGRYLDIAEQVRAEVRDLLAAEQLSQ